MTIAEAAARFGVRPAAVTRARKSVPSLALAELAVAALTDCGVKRTGSLRDLDGVAKWLDYVNHDASTVEDVRELLGTVPELVAMTAKGWRLVGKWP